MCITCVTFFIKINIAKNLQKKANKNHHPRFVRQFPTFLVNSFGFIAFRIVKGDRKVTTPTTATT